MTVPLPPLSYADLPRIPSAPESALTAALHRSLPHNVPAAPWRCTFDGLVWIQRAGDAAAAVLPATLQAGTSVGWLLGALVHYTESPVGPYSEVYAASMMRNGFRLVAHIPFIAVDSVASLRGGRANWAPPKTLADFDCAPSAPAVIRVRGTGWQVRARAGTFGPWLPMRITLPCAQVRPDDTIGRYSATIRGSARASRVDVDVASEASLANWMPSGQHLGTLWSNASLTVPAAVEATI
jgi:hypothetical protein